MHILPVFIPNGPPNCHRAVETYRREDIALVVHTPAWKCVGLLGIYAGLSQLGVFP